MAGYHPAAFTGSGCRMCDLNQIIGGHLTPHATYLVFPPSNSSTNSTAGVSVGKEQAGVSEEGAAPNYTTGTKGAGGTQYLAWR